MQRCSSGSLNRRQFLARSAAVAGAAAGAGLLGRSVAAGTAEAASAHDTTTITIMSETSEITPAYIAAFEKLHPNIKVNFLADDPTRLSAMFAAGSPPDIVRAMGASEMPHWVARGVAADLTSYFAKSTMLNPSNLLPVNDIFRFQGMTAGIGPRYGMVKDWSPDFSVWFNKDLFDTAGVKYISTTQPTSLEELLAIGKQVGVRKNGKVLVYGFDLGLVNGWTGPVIWALGQEGKSLFSADRTMADFTQPEARKFLQFLVDWAQAHVGLSPLDPDPSGWSGPPYVAQRVAMAMDGYWLGGKVNVPTSATNSKPLTNSALAPAPLWGATRTDPCQTGAGLFITAASKNKDAAWAFFEYYFGGQPAMDRATGGWGVPPLKSYMPDMPHGTAYQAAALKAVQAELPYTGKILQFSPYASATAMDAVIAQYLTPVMQGQGTVDSAAAQITAGVNKLLKLGKEQVS